MPKTPYIEHPRADPAAGVSNRALVAIDGSSACSQLTEKIPGIVGLYIEPPVNAVVFCVDEKSQIQAVRCSEGAIAHASGDSERCAAAAGAHKPFPQLFEGEHAEREGDDEEPDDEEIDAVPKSVLPHGV
jgi:hypothetical protein